MRKQLISTLCAWGALGLVSQAQAVSLTLQPNVQTIGVSSPASVDLVVSGLGDLSSPSLGAFTIDLSYNPALLSALFVAFGNFLDLGVLGSFRSSDLSTPGVIHLQEISLETPGALNIAQPGSFTLATLGFTGLAPGISGVAFSPASLYDELGQSFSGISTSDGSIEIRRVPDGGATLALVCLGFFPSIGLNYWLRGRRTQGLSVLS